MYDVLEVDIRCNTPFLVAAFLVLACVPVRVTEYECANVRMCECANVANVQSTEAQTFYGVKCERATVREATSNKMQNAKCKMQNVKCKMQNAKCKMQNLNPLIPYSVDTLQE